MLKDLKITEGDLVDDGNGSLEYIEGADAVTQNINHSLKLFLGEFFLEPGEGIDWLGIVEKPFAAKKLQDAIIAQLVKETAIESIEEFNIEPGATPRSIKVSWSVMAGGTRINGGDTFS